MRKRDSHFFSSGARLVVARWLCLIREAVCPLRRHARNERQRDGPCISLYLIDSDFPRIGAENGCGVGPASQGAAHTIRKGPVAHSQWNAKKRPAPFLVCERADKPGSVVGRPFISNACRQASLARNPNARKGGRIAFLFALAPDGVCQAALLPTRWCALTAPFQLFSRSSGGVFFSVALSVGSPRPAVSWHPALWSPDFPRAARARDRLAHSHVVLYRFADLTAGETTRPLRLSTAPRLHAIPKCLLRRAAQDAPASAHRGRSSKSEGLFDARPLLAASARPCESGAL